MENINYFIVFIEGILSIFSPCILPILPIYLSILSNSDIEEVYNGEAKNGRLIRNTIFFSFGISTTFFMLGSSINFLSSFINENRSFLLLFGGIFIVIMGLFYLGVIKSTLLSREKRFSYKAKSMNPLSSFLLGLTFSFGWTPCIGPILASVLVMASGSNSVLQGNILIFIYTIGFIIPFILVSLVYKKLYSKFNKVKEYMGVIKKISGVVIIFAGLIMIFNGIIEIKEKTIDSNGYKPYLREDIEKEKQQQEDSRMVPIDFTLYDQYGNEHTLSEYKGKTVFLNYWATWCPPCRSEMPYIEELYKEYNSNQNDVIILGVASPKLGSEGSEQDIKSFLTNEGYTFPVVLDNGGSTVKAYGLNAFPSTFIIDKEGYVAQYVPGAMNKATMQGLIESYR